MDRHPGRFGALGVWGERLFRDGCRAVCAPVVDLETGDDSGYGAFYSKKICA